jgi:CheY-like chemotaxis protein
MKQDFVSTVSHELRTPLTSIRGALGLVASGALGSLETEAKEMISVAERNSVRLISLINDILDFDRLESGRMEMHPRKMSMHTVIPRSIENVSTFADQEGVAIEVASDQGAMIADEDRIVQVLVNFLSNAIKFSPQGSTVTVASRVTEGQLECRVTDRGKGIAPDAQKRLFQRFHQADSSDSRRKGGTGLGLAISKAIIQQHGGAIGVESEPGSGSSFWFRLPALATKDGGEFELIDILVIEDDEALLKVLARQLHRDDAVIRTATTCAGGLSEIRARTPDLLVLDVELPDRDGFSLVDELRHDEALRSLPLLVYTGQDLTYDQRNRLRLGTTRFLMKSKESNEVLRALVSELLQPSEQA